MRKFILNYAQVTSLGRIIRSHTERLKPLGWLWDSPLDFIKDIEQDHNNSCQYSNWDEYSKSLSVFIAERLYNDEEPGVDLQELLYRKLTDRVKYIREK